VSHSTTTVSRHQLLSARLMHQPNGGPTISNSYLCATAVTLSYDFVEHLLKPRRRHDHQKPCGSWSHIPERVHCPAGNKHERPRSRANGFLADHNVDLAVDHIHRLFFSVMDVLRRTLPRQRGFPQYVRAAGVVSASFVRVGLSRHGHEPTCTGTEYDVLHAERHVIPPISVRPRTPAATPPVPDPATAGRSRGPSRHLRP
jgi:hypothetical protein